MFGLFRRKKLENLFGAYVSPDFARDAMKGDFSLPRLSTRDVYLLFVVVSGTPEEISARLGKVTNLARESRWLTCSLCSNLAVLAERGVLDNTRMQTHPERLARMLADQLGENCKSIGGLRTTVWGDYGGASRRTFGPLLSDFVEVVASLSRQPFGTHGKLDAR